MNTIRVVVAHTETGQRKEIDVLAPDLNTGLRQVENGLTQGWAVRSARVYAEGQAAG